MKSMLKKNFLNDFLCVAVETFHETSLQFAHRFNIFGKFFAISIRRFE